MVDRKLVLVTRTGVAGEKLAERLRQAGQDSVHCAPVRLAGPADRTAVAARLARMLPVDRVVMTSGEAIRQAVQLVGRDAFSSIPIIVPGPGSAREARDLDLPIVVSPSQAGNSEAMLDLPELTNIDGCTVVILAAAGGRTLLQDELQRRGARVERVHVYRRLHRALPQGLGQRIVHADQLTTLISSGGALQAMKSQLGSEAWAKLTASRMVVPSPRVAEMASEMGCRNVLEADGADDESMLKALG